MSITAESSATLRKNSDLWNVRPVDQILVKLAAECNLRCTYCYWFKDQEVLRLAPVMKEEVVSKFLERLREHIISHEIRAIRLILHGGEPLLFGKRRFAQLMKSLRSLQAETGCNIQVGITTNAVMVDPEWSKLFRYFSMGVTVSLDGPQAIHDRRRVTRSKRGTFERVTAGLKLLTEQSVPVGCLSVLDAEGVLSIGAKEVLDTYLRYGVTETDFLLPDSNHDSIEVPQVLEALKALFREWYDSYSHQGLRIRFFENVLLGLLGKRSKSEAIGLGAIAIMGVTTDGGLEPLDVLRINGSDEVNTNLNLREHSLQSIASHRLWQEAIQNTATIPSACQQCPVLAICGGGYLPHRFKTGDGYNNSSVYCSQLKEFILWSGKYIAKDLVRKGEI